MYPTVLGLSGRERPQIEHRVGKTNRPSRAALFWMALVASRSALLKPL